MKAIDCIALQNLRSDFDEPKFTNRHFIAVQELTKRIHLKARVTAHAPFFVQSCGCFLVIYIGDHGSNFN